MLPRPKSRPQGPEFALLRFTPAVRYALSAASTLARQPAGSFAAVEQLAGEGLPPSFLSKVMRRLARAGLIESRRGPGGGHCLALPPSKITLGDIVRAVEGSTHFRPDCRLQLRKCSAGTPCVIHDDVVRSEQAVWRALCAARLDRYARTPGG